MKKTFTLALFAINISMLYAQDGTVKDLQATATKTVKSLDSNGWHNSGSFIVNLNQGALSNWVGGGEENVFGVNGILNYALNYKQDKAIWDNYLDVAVGFQNATSFKRFRKIDDRFDLTSKYGRAMSKTWYYGILFNFYTQMLAGYDYSVEPEQKISSFLTPGRILLSPGFEYKPNSKFSVFMSPLTVRWILKRDPDFRGISRFGVDSGKTVNNELGAFITTRYITPLTTWATYSGRLDLFSNYRRNPQNVDLLMNNLLTMKFTKSLATNISLDLIYDDDAIGRLQMKEILGVGLTLKL